MQQQVLVTRKVNVGCSGFPRFSIHLIIRPSLWLKACCVASWHLVTPTLLSDESFVLRYQTVPREFGKNKKSAWFQSDCYNNIYRSEAKPQQSEGRLETDAICETLFDTLLPAHVEQGPYYIALIKIWKEGSIMDGWVLKISLCLSYLLRCKVLKHQEASHISKISHWSIRLIRHVIKKSSTQDWSGRKIKM